MITNKAAAVINSSALWLQLADPIKNKFNLLSSENLLPEQKSKLDQNPLDELNGWISENKQSILINEISKDARARPIKTVSRDFDSVLGVPLVSQDKVLGILYAAKREPFAYDEEDRELLQAFANQATIALENASLFEQLVSKERFEQELEVAHDAQRKLLPKKMPELPELDIDAISVTANEVGGDYY